MRLKLTLTALLLAISAQAAVKNFATQIDYINDSMPQSFEIGQRVDVSFAFDDNLIITENSKKDVVINDFKFSVANTDFIYSASNPKSTLEYNASNDKCFLSVFGGNYAFEGKNLVSINFFFTNGNPSASEKKFSDYAYDSFSFSFYDPETSTVTTGSSMILKPVPNTGGLEPDFMINDTCDKLFDLNGNYLSEILRPSPGVDNVYPIPPDSALYPIPEPAEWSAILALFAMLIVAKRRR